MRFRAQSRRILCLKSRSSFSYIHRTLVIRFSVGGKNARGWAGTRHRLCLRIEGLRNSSTRRTVVDKTHHFVELFSSCVAAAKSARWFEGGAAVIQLTG